MSSRGLGAHQPVHRLSTPRETTALTLRVEVREIKQLMPLIYISSLIQNCNIRTSSFTVERRRMAGSLFRTTKLHIPAQFSLMYLPNVVICRPATEPVQDNPKCIVFEDCVLDLFVYL
ncbi:hypothetical protein AAFF_G00169650 [Aldrovandia affinis]|uniref:Uncharacterized protein n=1 Tax=Aldrovandia affinis TaxID=143900 RepID=A0AAD7RLZ6_9TELE|nr:hypothetical protein AAFF_G00169650 [Aldrovandia affinis]